MSHDRVRTLEMLYAQGQASDVTDLALEKLMAYELSETQQQLVQLQKDLGEFEQRYALSSESFYAHFQAGQLGDAMDYVDWASLYQMAERLRQRIILLKAS